MRRSVCLFALVLIAVSSHRALAQARQQGAGSMRDTLPDRVAQRTMNAWVRNKDLDAAYANFDSVFTHEYLSDSAGAKRVRRDEWIRQLKSDTAAMRQLKATRLELLRHDVSGPFVSDVWVAHTPDGKTLKHFELFEVRHGKIVREIES